MRSVNKVILVGRVAADPEIRQTPNGTPVANFPLAVNRDWESTNGDKKKAVDFHRIIVWRKLAEATAQYFLKGTGLYVEGRLMNRSYDDKDGNKKYITEIVADSINVMVWKKRDDGTQEMNLSEPEEKKEKVAA